MLVKLPTQKLLILLLMLRKGKAITPCQKHFDSLPADGNCAFGNDYTLEVDGYIVYIFGLLM